MEPEKKSNGALIGSIIIIVILVIGGIYIWQSKVSEAPKEESQQTENTAGTEANENELNSLEQDINSANVELEASAIDSVQ